MNVLDTTSIPYGVVPGNHDCNTGADYSFYNSNFGPASSHFAGKSWYGGASASYGNSVQFFTTPSGRRFMALQLDSNQPAYAVPWAQTIINQNPGVATLVTMHNYLIPGGRTTAGTSPSGPGDQFYNNLIKTNPQIFMVLNGHTDTSRFQESANNAGGRVFEALADYQFYSNNTANGYMRLIQFNPDSRNIHIETISAMAGTELLSSPQTVNGHTWDYNNVDFSNVPEPATLSLLAIGGLAALVRRRRR
jgi:hypothetical protein